MLILKALESNYFDNNSVTAYDLQSEICKLTHSIWEPSPGSIYPILHELVQKQFVSVEKRENKEYYALTQEGKDTFNRILSYKLLTDVVMHTRLYYTFDPGSIQLPTQTPQFKKQIQQMVLLMGELVEQGGISAERIHGHLTGFGKAVQKEQIRDFIKGIDKYIQLLEIFKEKFTEELDKYNFEASDKQ